MTSIFAHRGYHHVYPENSVAAVASARELGADGVEIDVWLSADKYLMVNHDRTLNGLDISRTPRGELRADASLATLPEILEAAAGTRINVEIKATRSRAYNEAVARAVAQHLDASPASRQCLVSSFSLAVCDEVRRVSPQRPVGWLVTYRRADEVLDRVLEHRLTSAHFPFSRVSEAVARRARDQGIELHVWTPNLERDLQRMLELGVGVLITDEVPRALALRERHRATRQ